jgi:hypothetical protein
MKYLLVLIITLVSIVSNSQKIDLQKKRIDFRLKFVAKILAKS